MDVNNIDDITKVFNGKLLEKFTNLFKIQTANNTKKTDASFLFNKVIEKFQLQDDCTDSHPNEFDKNTIGNLLDDFKIFYKDEPLEKKNEIFMDFLLFMIFFFDRLKKSYLDISKYNTSAYRRLGAENATTFSPRPIYWFFCLRVLRREEIEEAFYLGNYTLFWNKFGDYLKQFKDLLDFQNKRTINIMGKEREILDEKESIKDDSNKFNFFGYKYELVDFYKKVFEFIEKKEKVQIIDNEEIIYDWIASTHKIKNENTTSDELKKSEYNRSY